ncbi:unnamed protein product, partial [Mesorhabditis spiculigera]
MLCFLLVAILPAIRAQDQYLPTRCETCVLLGREFDDYLMKTKKSETHMVEGMDNICKNLIAYRLHKEHEGLARFQKQDSQTMEGLKKLREQGVQVELGLPPEFWDQPSVEIAELQRICETIIEQYEDVVETWYWKKGWNFMGEVCQHRVLRGGDLSCLPKLDPEPANEENEF